MIKLFDSRRDLQRRGHFSPNPLSGSCTRTIAEAEIVEFAEVSTL